MTIEAFDQDVSVEKVTLSIVLSEKLHTERSKIDEAQIEEAVRLPPLAPKSSKVADYIDHCIAIRQHHKSTQTSHHYDISSNVQSESRSTTRISLHASRPLFVWLSQRSSIRSGEICKTIPAVKAPFKHTDHSAHTRLQPRECFVEFSPKLPGQHVDKQLNND